MKKLFSLILCGALILNVASFDFSYATATFKDVPQSHWAYENINKMVDMGFLKGYPDGTFRPSGTITVAEYLKLIALCLNSNISQGEGSSWAYPYLEYLCEKGITSEQVFPKNQLSRGITRAEMAELLGCCVKYLDLKLSENIFVDALAKANVFDLENPDFNLDTFKDLNLNDMTATLFVAPLYGLLNGYPDGTFKPLGYLTRAEACATIARLKWYKPDEADFAKQIEEKYFSETAEKGTRIRIFEIRNTGMTSYEKENIDYYKKNETQFARFLEELFEEFPGYTVYELWPTFASGKFVWDNESISEINKIINVLCEYKFKENNFSLQNNPLNVEYENALVNRNDFYTGEYLADEPCDNAYLSEKNKLIITVPTIAVYNGRALYEREEFL